jgi:hypothetical protein
MGQSLYLDAGAASGKSHEEAPIGVVSLPILACAQLRAYHLLFRCRLSS